MRCTDYYACCGAYFLSDVTEEDINNPAEKPADLPQKKNAWGELYPDPSKGGVGYHISSYVRPGIAYFFCILKPEQEPLGKLLVKKWGFELMEKTKDRLLYCKVRK